MRTLYLIFAVALIATQCVMSGGTFGQRCAKNHDKGSFEWEQCVSAMNKGEIK